MFANLKAWLRRRREWFLAPLAYIVLVAVLYHTVWLPPDGKPKQYFGWDTPEAYWPDMAYFSTALAHGEAPLWNPYNRGGYAFYADLLPGVFYPPTWLFVGPGAIADAMPPWTIQAKALLHHVVAGLLLYVFLRRRKLPWPACFLGGAAFVVSLPMIIHKASALIWGLVWAPLLWVAIELVIDGARERGWWWRAIGLGGVVWVSGAAGMPQGSFMAIFMSIAYGALRLGQHLRDAHRDKRLRATAIVQARAFAVAAATAFALLAIVVLPSMREAAASATRGAARDLGYVLTFRVPPKSLLGALAPGAGPVDMYCGLVVLVLAVTALASLIRSDRWTPALFAGTALFGILLAHGADGGILPWLARHVPGFALFREPNRYKLVAALSASVLAAYGLAALLSEEAQTRRRARIAAAATIGVLVIAIAITKAVAAHDPHWPGYARSFEVLVACAVVLAALVWLPRRWLPAAACAFVVVHYLDVGHFGAAHIALREAPGIDREGLQYVADLGDVSREWRIWDEFVLGRRAGSRFRLRDLRGYVAGDPFDTVRYDKMRTRLRTVPELLAAFNVRWVLWGTHPTRGYGDHIIKTAPSFVAPARFHRLDAKRWEVVDPAPLVAWYGGAEIQPNADRVLDAMAAREKGRGPRRRAIIDAEDRPADLAGLEVVAEPPPSVPGQLISYGANRIEVAVDAPASGIVVLNEVMAPGWNVEVDGQGAEAFRTELLLRGVVVQPGHHVIVWSYHPPGFRVLFVLWLAGIIGLLVAAIAAIRASIQSVGSSNGHGP